MGADPFAARLAELDKEQSTADPFAARLAEMDKESAPVDMGPEARGAAQRGMRPAVKSDEDLGLDEGPQFYRGVALPKGLAGTRFDPAFGRIVPRAQDAPGTAAYAARHVGDEMNDPIAQAITSGAVAAPVAALAGAAAPAALQPLVSGAAGGAAQAGASEGDPRVGALLGALPGVPAAARTADQALGEAALNRATGPSLVPVAQKLGKVVGMVAGGAKGLATGGPVGLGVGAYAGGKAGAHIAGKLASGIDKAAAALARRHLLQEAEADLARAADLPAAGQSLSDRAARSMARSVDVGAARAVPAPRPKASGFTANPLPVPEPPEPITLAPLKPEGPVLPSRVPPGALGTPYVDEFGVPLTQASPPAVNHSTVGGATVGGARPRLQIVDESGRDLLATAPTEATPLRDVVARDAQRFRTQPYDIDEPPPQDVGGQIDQSIQVLNLMKQAKEAGTLTPTLIRSAIKLGMPAQAVLKIVGKDAFTAALKPPGP